MKRKYRNSSWYFYVHSGDRDVTAGSSHDFGAYCECGIDWNSICSVLLAYQKKWRIRIIKSSEEKNSLAVEVERPRKVRMMEIMVRTKGTPRYMNGIHGAEGNESKRYLPIYLHMEK